MPNVGRPSRDCQACRKRRIKCDLLRPECRQCQRRGQICPGYRDELDVRFRTESVSTFQSNMYKDRRRTRHQENDSSVSVTTRLRATTSRWIGPGDPYLCTGNAEENQYFNFFRTITAPDLAGVLDFGFWTYDTLQVSRWYPALWHAATALGAMHHRFITDSSLPYYKQVEADNYIRFALGQFNKSIQNLTILLSERVLSEQDKTVILTTCILFVCLCALQDCHKQAVMHISNGMKLIHEWKIGENTFLQDGSRVAMNMLLMMFAQLDSQARFVRQLMGLKITEQRTKYLIAPPPALQPFSTCLEANVELERLVNCISRFTKSEDYTSLDPDSLSKEREIYSQAFAAWDARFRHYLTTTVEPIQENSIILCRIRRLYVDTLLFYDPSTGELGYDEFVDKYAVIIHLAERILESRSVDRVNRDVGSTANSTANQIKFSLAVIIWEPLFFIAMRCRQSTLRQRALRLLKMHPRREGLGDPVLGVKLLEAYITFEEKSCSRSRRLADDEDCSNTGSITSNTGLWICQNHRVSLPQFLRISGPQAQVILQVWRA